MARNMVAHAQKMQARREAGLSYAFVPEHVEALLAERDALAARVTELEGVLNRVDSACEALSEDNAAFIRAVLMSGADSTEGGRG